jgi:hypothetical protein
VLRRVVNRGNASSVEEGVQSLGITGYERDAKSAGEQGAL